MATTDEVNLELLIKLLNMTTSENDNIALMSVRKANDQIRKVGGDWETLLRGKVKIIPNPFAGAPLPQQDDLDSMARNFTPPPAASRPPPDPHPAGMPDPTQGAAWSPPNARSGRTAGAAPNFQTGTAQPRPRPRPPHPKAIWNHALGQWEMPQRPPQPHPTATWDDVRWQWIMPPQTAKVVFTKRGNSWILRSDQPLTGFDIVDVTRKDGRVEREQVGTLIHSEPAKFGSGTDYYYNIRGKTNFAPVSNLVI